MISRLAAAVMAFAALFVFSANVVPIGSAAAADFAKATYRGKPLKCPKGTHFSLRKGGQCWACPKGMKRTVLPITGKWACERPAYTTWRPAKKHRRNSRVGQGCPKGQFWNVKGGKGLLGACYSCPRGYRKSVHSVTSKRGCRQRHKLVKARAKFVQEQGCPRGSFRHLGRGGGCYSCPKGWHRTVNSIRSSKACARKLIGVMAVDGSGVCKSVLNAVRASASGAQKVNKAVQTVTAPVRKPVEAVMRKLVPPIKTPRSLNKLIDKAAGVMGRYRPVQEELRRVGGLAMRNPGKLSGILLNPRLMCEGGKKQIIRALVRAGLNPNFRPRRAGLMDGFLIKSAHAGNNATFHTIFISSGTRKPGKPVGLGIGVTLVTDLKNHLRIYYSLPSLFASRFAGYEFTAGYMIFPWTNIDNFDQIGNLGLEISIGRGQTTKAPGTRLEKIMKGWPDGLGFNVSFDPGFVKNPRGNIPGFGISWAWGDEPGTPKPGAKVKSLSPSMSVDYSFPLRSPR